MIFFIFFGLLIVIVFTLALCKAASKDEWSDNNEKD